MDRMDAYYARERNESDRIGWKPRVVVSFVE